MIEIYLISGFLGAGKTTLIQKILKEEFEGKKIALIENDFGKVSFDAALLSSSGVEVKEINSGCICCTLFGDFIQAIMKIHEEISPDIIIIEPSGVGKLSDIMRACTQPDILEFAQVVAKIAVVDIKRYKLYLERFSEFYEDQIANADIIVFSRTEQYSDKIDEAFNDITNINPNVFIFTQPWNQIAASDIIDSAKIQVDAIKIDIKSENELAEKLDHDHAANEIFESITIRPKIVLSEDELIKRFTQLVENGQGLILRAKGILPSTSRHLILQYLPQELKITNSDIEDNSLTIIGAKLDRREILNAFY